MRVVICIRQGLDGEIGPFDACAYETALQIAGAEVILLSMGPITVRDFLLRLTRLGAKKAILLCDKAFAGADTLATAYTLSLAIKRLGADLVLCGRQTLVGDTAQTGAMLSALCGFSLITNVMDVRAIEDARITCDTRCEGEIGVKLPAVLTVERINKLRLPRLRSKVGEVEVWNADEIGANRDRCGLSGSPTRVLKTFENQSGKRKCTFIQREQLTWAIAEGLRKSKNTLPNETQVPTNLLSKVCIVGETPRAFAKTVCDEPIVIPLTNAEEIKRRILEIDPDAVLWGSDSRSKRIAAVISAALGLGLCADCTQLTCEDDTLMMYRPALSGSIVAKIKSLTRPAMATVRTDSGNNRDILVAAGYGVATQMERVKQFAEELGSELCSTRRVVADGYLPYDMQVGLTGKTVSPPVYIAIGVSGAVQHLVGMQRAGTVIAINPDKNAPIFEYADYGIIDTF